MPKKNGEPTKKELRDQETQKLREEWEEPEDVYEFPEPEESFKFCKTGPKNVEKDLRPKDIFLLFWGSFLPTVAKGMLMRGGRGMRGRGEVDTRDKDLQYFIKA